MKKLLAGVLSAAIAAASLITFAGCNKGEKELTAEDGVFNRNCTFSMDLNYKSEVPPPDWATSMANVIWMLNPEVNRIMTESGDPSERFEECNLHFTPEGKVVFESKYTQVVAEYIEALSAFGDFDNVEEGTYRITKKSNSENIYTINTSINGYASYEYDSETKLLSGSKMYVEEFYDLAQTKAIPEVEPKTFDYSSIQGVGEKEAKYLAMGEYEVASDYIREKENKTWFSHKIWYPTDIAETDKKIPLIVMANGTGTPYIKYEYVFEHLASWGFIVVGNDETNSALGFASEASLQLMISLNADSNSKFYGKVDVDNVGSMGHSQGGAGAISAVVNNPDSAQRYKAIYAASPSHAAYLGDCFDVSKVNIPFFAIAGTNHDDAQDGLMGAPLSSLENLQFNYNSIADSVTKIIARRQGAGHGDTKTWGDGYAVAWFLWHLQGNTEAQADFKEILNNEKWTDIQNNLK